MPMKLGLPFSRFPFSANGYLPNSTSTHLIGVCFPFQNLFWNLQHESSKLFKSICASLTVFFSNYGISCADIVGLCYLEGGSLICLFKVCQNGTRKILRSSGLIIFFLYNISSVSSPNKGCVFPIDPSILNTKLLHK